MANMGINNGYNLSIYSPLCIIAIVCVLAYIMFIVDTQQAIAQNNTGGMRSYTKNATNISYPFNWKIVENNSKFNIVGKFNIVVFLAPSQNSSDIHPELLQFINRNCHFHQSKLQTKNLCLMCIVLRK